MMRFSLRMPLLLVATSVLLLAPPASAKLKRVPVNGDSQVIRPSATQNKKIEAKKIKAKKASIAERKAKKKPEVIEIESLSKKERARLVEEARSITVAPEQPEGKGVEVRGTAEQAVETGQPVEGPLKSPRVDRLSEAAPTQVTVEKDRSSKKEKKRGLFGWLFKKKE